ncbi:MAG: 2-oxo acid dehydrogenase subunit E2 [Chloroflexi bacterium]|nr:MAG: 2-oxo acid dehydrogenase subunit E2 [Chloroflexota bacterium]MBL1196161.1 2-oxo acid dehydrogenase subunit E2 [Chloroflexota bacterium]NOH13454.1 2-oxo acid dehydrogenase subunit E2 [Chloroflexota bacterium]
MADIVNMPKLGFDMAEGTLIAWVKGEGETIDKGELLAEIETDKATVEVESNFAGTVLKQLVTEGAIVPVSSPIAVIGEAGEEVDVDALMAEAGGDATEEAAATPEPAAPSPAPAAPAPVSTPAPAATPAGNSSLPGGVKASPVARRMAADNSINIASVSGTGPDGRIIKKDVEAYLATPPAERAAAPAPEAEVPAGPALAPLAGMQVGEVLPDQEIPLSRLRGAIGRRMVQSTTSVPHFYVTYEYDLGPLMSMRKQANAMLAGSGEKLSVNDFVLKATALNLRNFPNLNARLDGDRVLHMGRVNLGVAVAVENGLLVVVTHDADRKSLRQISLEVKEKAGRARAGQVHPDDIEGSTFSTSNLGMYGVEDFVAIINPPEAGILALGGAKQVPVVEDGEVTVGWRMKATISVDHRVSDGAEGAEFMQKLKDYLENPVSLML